MRGKCLLSISDLSLQEIEKIFEVAKHLKSMSIPEQVDNPLLAGKTLAMIFEKPSLRTRVTFETGMTQLGGHAINIQSNDIQLGKRESVPDIARNLSRWVQGVMARVFSHNTVVELANYGSVPVINALSDVEHPCQALADFFTLIEHKQNLRSIKLAYVGDGNNVCHSLMLLAGKVGTNMTIGCPKEYEPDPVILETSRKYASEMGSSINVVNDPYEAVIEADAIYTDVWASMGQEDEKSERTPIFQPYQVNNKLVNAASDDVIILHCLPAKRGEEITDEVIDSPYSVVLDEAENRLHVQKAVMALIM